MQGAAADRAELLRDRFRRALVSTSAARIRDDPDMWPIGPRIRFRCNSGAQSPIELDPISVVFLAETAGPTGWRCRTCGGGPFLSRFEDGCPNCGARARRALPAVLDWQHKALLLGLSEADGAAACEAANSDDGSSWRRMYVEEIWERFPDSKPWKLRVVHSLATAAGLILLPIVFLAVVGAFLLAGHVVLRETQWLNGGPFPSADFDVVHASYRACRGFVLQRIETPATATFGDADAKETETKVSANGWQHRVTSYVDAQNRFGAVERLRFSCTVTWRYVESADTPRWVLDDLTTSPWVRMER